MIFKCWLHEALNMRRLIWIIRDPSLHPDPQRIKPKILPKSLTRDRMSGWFTRVRILY